MKFVALLLLCCLTVGLVTAFPYNHIGAADLPDGVEDVDPATQTVQLRQPRHLLKKLFSPEPQVVVQPILVPQQQPYFPGLNPYAGVGRGNSYG
ncbi:hypothetical protein KR093_004162, partial [Drosophila rubida]